MLSGAVKDTFSGGDGSKGTVDTVGQACNVRGGCESRISSLWWVGLDAASTLGLGLDGWGRGKYCARACERMVLRSAKSPSAVVEEMLVSSLSSDGKCARGSVIQSTSKC